jgi:hypothetical protein
MADIRSRARIDLIGPGRAIPSGMTLLASAMPALAVLLVAASAAAQTPAAPPPAAPAPPPAAAVPVYPAPLPYGGAVTPPYAVYTTPEPSAPRYWMGQPPVLKRHSNAMRITGITLFGVGGVVSAIGGVIFGAVATTGCVLTVDDGPAGGAPTRGAQAEHISAARQALNGCDTSPFLGMGIFAAGIAIAGAGIPLLVVGSKREPAAAPMGKLLPSVSVGAGSGSLRWTF